MSDILLEEINDSEVKVEVVRDQIDEILASFIGRGLLSTDEVADKLLDIRNTLTNNPTETA